MLTVFNVGQGDSLLLHPAVGCHFSEVPLLIDCGPKGALSGSCGIPNVIALMLTHSHEDHVGGLDYLLTNHQITTLFIPKYWPEILKLAEYFGQNVISTNNSINWNRLKNIKIVALSDGDFVGEKGSGCDLHSIVLNPPKQVKSFNFGPSFPEMRDFEILEALNYLRRFEFNLPEEEITNYVTPIVMDAWPSRVKREYLKSSRLFIHSFMVGIANAIRLEGAASAISVINRQHKLTSNQASIVFKYAIDDVSYMFTGDADQNAFQRFMGTRNRLKADVLKVPHHGSANNLSLAILKKIKPSIAIFSHNNRKFGSSGDSHPNMSIINMMRQEMVQSYFTNDVIKNGVTVYRKSTGSIVTYPIQFK